MYISLYEPRLACPSRGRYWGGVTLTELQQRLDELALTSPDGLLDALAADVGHATRNAERHG
ncbi:hypothetical protein [Deinococcus pimensis]|uniref:hypothetical protein n=1 Tax=Deinococcus pimensis TaxID=309888 RepID=UPI00048887C8|nr:hypothetical protein [Deinococcus pimensis]